MKTRLGKSCGRKTNGVTVAISAHCANRSAGAAVGRWLRSRMKNGSTMSSEHSCALATVSAVTPGFAEVEQQRREERDRRDEQRPEPGGAEEPGQLGIGHQCGATGAPGREDPPHDPDLEADPDSQADRDPGRPAAGPDGEHGRGTHHCRQQRGMPAGREQESGGGHPDRPDADPVPSVGRRGDGDEAEAGDEDHQQRDRGNPRLRHRRFLPCDPPPPVESNSKAAGCDGSNAGGSSSGAVGCPRGRRDG